MGSSRLPGKVLRTVAGTPLIGHQIRRLRACDSADDIVVATTDSTDDDELVAVVQRMGVTVHRGSRDDVLGRVLGAAREARADVVIRVTGDCPLIDPMVTGRVVDAFMERPACDYASNVLTRTYPRGLDAEAISLDA